MTSVEEHDIRILIIEDDPDQSALIERALQRHSRVTNSFARNGEEALDLISDFRPDLIVLDFRLPGRSGILLLNDLRARDENAMIIVQSAEHSDGVVQACLNGGAYDYLRKPYSINEFSLKIKNYIDVVRQKKELNIINERVRTERDTLKKFFPRDFTENLLAGKISNEVGGDIKRITTLICDLRESTRLAEEIPPADFAQFLSDFFADIADLIFGCEGSINNFRGDGFLATFGVPNTTGRDAANACEAALRIRKHLSTVNEFRPDFLKDPLRMGYGISTGSVFVGNIGSVHRLDYTVLGDSVNLAARLESLTKKAGVDLLIDGETLEQLGAGAKVRPVKVSGIRGKKQEVSVYYLEDYAGEGGGA